MSGLGAPEFRILSFWMAPWKTLKTSLKRRVSTHFRRPWAGGRKSVFQDGEYATFLGQFFHHRFLRCKPCWIPRTTLQMWSEHANHDTKAGLGAPEGLVNRFVTLFSVHCANSCVTCDSRDREYGTFLSCFFHDRFSRYKSYEFQELRYQHAPSSKNTRQKLPSSNFRFTSGFSSQKTFFLIFDTFLGFWPPVTRH